MNDPVVQSLLTQAIELVGGVLGALILWEIKRLVAAKHLQTQVETATNLATASGLTYQKVSAYAAKFIAAWLSAHGHKTTAQAISTDISAVVTQAEADEKAAEAAAPPAPAPAPAPAAVAPQVVVVPMQVPAPPPPPAAQPIEPTPAPSPATPAQ